MIQRLIYGALATLMLLTLLAGCGVEDKPDMQTVLAELRVPETETRMIVDTLFGRPIQDPYRWLEDGDNAEVIEWTRAQNEYTRTILEAIPGRDTLLTRIEEALNVGSVYAPVERGGRLFYLKRYSDQDQPVLFTRENANSEEDILVDPNALSERAETSIDWFYPSRTGRYVAYGLSEGGDEQSVLHIVDIENREKIFEKIPRTTSASVAWFADDSGFYYTRNPKIGEVPTGDEVYYRHVYSHELGTDPADDRKVFGDSLDKEAWTNVYLSESGRYILIYAFYGWSRTELYLQDRESGSSFLPIVKDVEAYTEGVFAGENLFIRTNNEAPNYKVLKAVYGGDGITSWQEVVPENEEAPLIRFGAAGGKLILGYVRDVSSDLKYYDPQTKEVATIGLPYAGTVSGFDNEHQTEKLYFKFQSFFVPPTIYTYDFAQEQLAIYDRIEVDIDPYQYESKLVEYFSKDSSRITMFVVHKSGIELDNQNPTILTGYGGFSHVEAPYYSNTRRIWLDAGGVFALPHLRGGGEYGESWHEAGKLGKKQSTFDDFIAAAEYLIEQGYTSRDKLAIWGGSNGGLLVGAAMVQRPDLFKAVICGNPLLDMLRYHEFLIARLWIPEYGDPDKAEDFEWLYAYSPYHNVEGGTNYPACLVETSDTDTRVDPMHARKMVARLQHANAGDNPQMLRFEFSSGHGHGVPVWKHVDNYLDSYSFLMWQTGMLTE